LLVESGDLIVHGANQAFVASLPFEPRLHRDQTLPSRLAGTSYERLAERQESVHRSGFGEMIALREPVRTRG
jgi:hypothetical protein